MSIPLPPGYKKPPETPAPTTPRSTRVPTGGTRVPKAIEPTKPVAKSTVVDRDETAFLMQRFLRPEHREDPNVIGFIREYLICRSVSQAATAIGLTRRDGENLRRRPDIHETICQITEKALLKHGYDAGEIVERVKEIVRVDPIDLENPDGTFKTSMSQIPPEARRGIKKFKAKNTYGLDPNGMKVVTGQIIEVEYWDKLKAAELLGREKDTFKETKKVEHDITKNMSNVLLESKKRAEEAISELREVGEQPIAIGYSQIINEGDEGQE